jgi:hypothetical protein
MTSQQPKNAGDASGSTEPSTADNRLTPKWRNWGDHPIIVAITLFGTLLTIIVTAWGLPKLIREATQDKTSREVIVKTPIELVSWYKSIDNEIEARRQAKALYVGKLINISGKPEILTVTSSSTRFMLSNAYSNIRTSQIPNAGLSSNYKSSFTCRIREISAYVFLDECEIDE